MASIYDRVLQESTLFELFDNEAYTDTLIALKLAQDQISEKILSLPNDTWTKIRLASVKTKIDSEIAKAYSKTLPTLQKELPGIAAVTAKNMLNTDFVKVPTDVIDRITSSGYEVQGYDIEDLFGSLSDNHARQLKVIVGAGVAQGKSSASIVTSLVAKNSSLSKKQLKNAMFTTITEARAVTRHASYAQMEKNGLIDHYEYLATLDSHTTEYCRNHDGRNYYKNISEIQSEINVHFHCRSVFVPKTKSYSGQSRASIFGQVPDESYSKWFGRQSDAFQLTTLGKAKFNAYKTGAYKIGGLADVTGKVLSLNTIGKALDSEAVDVDINPIYKSGFDELSDIEQEKVWRKWAENADYGIDPSSSDEAFHQWGTYKYSDYKKEFIDGTKTETVKILKETFDNTYGNWDGSTIYRGMNIEKKGWDYTLEKDIDNSAYRSYIKNLKVGDKLEDLTPTSFSKDKNIATGYTFDSGNASYDSISVLIKADNITIEGYDISSISNHQVEKEILTKPNTPLTIKTIENKVDEAGRNYIEIYVRVENE